MKLSKVVWAAVAAGLMTFVGVSAALAQETAKPARVERPERPDRTERRDRPERPDHDRRERPEHPGRAAEKPVRPEGIGGRR